MTVATAWFRPDGPWINEDGSPVVGSFWAWEPDKEHAMELVRVLKVRIDEDGQHWVKTRGHMCEFASEARDYWNELSRFYEAAIPVKIGALD